MKEFDKAGFLNIHKEAGFTSHDVVAKLRGILHTKKVGHTGTLDPMATGVLPVAIGRAAKTIELLSDHSKAYTALMQLGTETDTYDSTGTVTAESEVNVSEEEVRKACASFVGRIEQLPPMYSAKKVDGKRLYELARQGKQIERTPQQVEIFSLCITEMKLPYVEFTVECSKGTYIRSLCHDIGAALGCGACMAKLTRTRAGSFLLEDALRLSEIEEARDAGKVDEILLPTDAAFIEYPRVVLSDRFTTRALNGTQIPKEMTASEGTDAALYRMYLANGSFLGLYSLSHGYYHVKKLCLLSDV